MRAAVFPGQGSQAVGMGRELAESFVEARELFQEVDDALDQHLSKLMWDGPIEDLTLTENAQPALMAHSIAVQRVLEKQGGAPLSDRVAFAAGHSLGEYSALAAMGALTVADAARLLKTRGRAMQTATPVGEGAMAALLGLDLETAEAVAAEAAQGEVCAAANDNAPGQVVVSGSKAAVERACEIAKTKGAKRAMQLPVSAPFHCALMAPAAEVMAEALEAVRIAKPARPIVANVRAAAVEEPDEIRALLVEQVTGRVRWRESVLWLAEQGVEELLEIGAGKVLAGLAKRIHPDLSARAIGAPADVEAALAAL
ncbi:MAG: ACP S-malonyltransferase [Pseudomonadota bacterium]